MMNYACVLFGFSAVLNCAVGAALLFLRPWLLPILEIPPDTHPTLLNFAGTVIIVFGYGYFRIAVEPVYFRGLIHIGAIGKLLAFGSAVWPWLMGATSARLPILLSVDVLLALMYLDYLWRTRWSAGQ